MRMQTTGTKLTAMGGEARSAVAWREAAGRCGRAGGAVGGAWRGRGLVWALWIGLVLAGSVARVEAAPPVVRSTAYNGAYSNIVHFALAPWMNTNTALMTVETWMYASDLNGFQALVARHFTDNLWFGLNGNRLRFYRSGGTLADSDGTVVAGRWTHVAVTYDGATARFYINGVLSGTKALSNAGNNSTNGLSLGGQRVVLSSGDSSAQGYAFNGYLDEVRVWSVVRSGSAIASAMNSEVRSGTGLLATFGSGGDREDLRGALGGTFGTGIPVDQRESGFGILPAELCIPSSATTPVLDGNPNLVTEYRGSEVLVLRSTLSATAQDRAAYLMVVSNATTHHLYVGVPDLQQAGDPYLPTVQVQADVNPLDGGGLNLGDWECRLEQDGLQGGRIYGVNPPFFPDPTWLSWGQSVSNWQASTLSPFEFTQSYEFRIHARHLNQFASPVGLMVRYYGYGPTLDQLAGPRGAVTNQPTTYVRASWCGRVDAPVSSVSLVGSVTNLGSNLGVSGRTVRLYSGNSELTGQLMATRITDAQGRFSFLGESVPADRAITVTYDPPGSIVPLTPEIDFSYSSRVPVSTNSPFSVTYAACASGCNFGRVNFRYRELGPVGVTGAGPSPVTGPVIVRTSPLKTAGGGTVTVTGSNFHAGVDVYFRGAGCALIPPSLCTGDFTEAVVTSVAPDGRSLEVAVPAGLVGSGLSTVTRSYQMVVGNPGFASTGGERWIYGPSVTVVPPPFPQLHGFEFVNRDDGPSVAEFEACYGDSIFNIFRLREPYYGLWAAVYMIWMDGCKGSCYGMAGTSRVMSDGYLPPGTYDVPGGDGVHGVRYANGYMGRLPCEVDGELCPPMPARYTGFDLFQPHRPLNLWGRITSFAGAQTSAEALGSWLGQLGRPRAFGARRGLAAGDPLDVLNRVRSQPWGYTMCMYGRDFENGHCVTPYGVRDGFRLDAANARVPEPAAGFSLIQVYDNNWPEEERLVEVNTVENTFRYNSGLVSGIYEGPGLFFVPASVYRGARHAPDPIFLGRYGLEFLRILAVGTAGASLTDTAGGRVGWGAGRMTNSYEGALTYVPPGALRDGASPIDTTMLFLPGTNAPTGGGFFSKGSAVMLYGGMGWGDIAFGFNAANAGASNSVDGILIGLNQGLVGMGLKVGAPVSGFSAMVSGREPSGRSRVLLLDAGSGLVSPDLRIERDGLKSVTLRNRGGTPLVLRMNLAGTDLVAGTFEQAYDAFTLPALATMVLRLPENPALRQVVRELDTNGDGQPESVEEAPANGRLRIQAEAGLLAVRWREAGFGGVLETAPVVGGGPGAWTPAGGQVTTEGGDRVVRVKPEGNAGFYRLSAPGTNCLSLASFAVGPRPNPWETNGFKFEAVSAAGAMLAQNAIVSRGGFVGLDVGHTVRVHPDGGADRVVIDVYQTSGLVTFEAVGPLGAVVSRAVLTGPGTGLQRVVLSGFRGLVNHVRVVSPNALCLIANVCAERSQPPGYSTQTACLSFSNAVAGQFPSPTAFSGVGVTAVPGPVVVGPVGGLSGHWLKLGGTVTLQFTEPCDSVRLRLADFEGVVVVRGYDAAGGLVAVAGPGAASVAPQELTLSGGAMVRVVLESTSDKAWLQDVCCTRRLAP